MTDLDWLLDHSQSPYHRGNPDPSEAIVTGTLSSQVCADRVVLHALVTNGRIRELWHSAQGCIVSQAGASFLCEWAEEKSVREILEMPESEYLRQLGELTPRRQPCALQAFRCLKRMFSNRQ